MVERLQQTLPSLYEEDETAWLEVMAGLITQKRFEEMDYQNLSEYLHDMAISQRREVYSRLVGLIAHLLKWDLQSEYRSNSWRATIVFQRLEVQQLVKTRTLRRHAETILPEVYQDAIAVAAAETGLPASQFPKECTRTLDQILSEDLAA